MRKLTGLLTIFTSLACQAQTDSSIGRNWSIHGQLTTIGQGHPAFRALYSSTNSLANTAEPSAISLTSTLFAARKISPNGTLVFNAELSGGRGMSSTKGIAGFPNGETYRIGTPTPTLYIARFYWQQVIPLTHNSYEWVSEDANQVASRLPSNRLVVIAGKFSNTDFFDQNSHSHDPRTQFMNWSLMSNGAWDYAANVRGYTYGWVLEWIRHSWNYRLSGVLEPNRANGTAMDPRFLKAQGLTLEVARSWKHDRPGAIRLLIFRNSTMAPSYQATLQQVARGDSSNLAIISGEKNGVHYGGIKYGMAFNWEQSITGRVKGFFKTSWNDGKNATWAFTEIDRSLSGGLEFQSDFLHRKQDHLGVAGVINGISNAHRQYLKEGFHGFLLGDGGLRYGAESIFEFYYQFCFARHIYLAVDNQYVNHPGYNKDRGPVYVYGLRLHLEW